MLQATVNVAQSQTDSVIVAAVAGKRIVVNAFHLMCGGTATVATFNSKGAGAGTAISPAYPCGANGGIAPPPIYDGDGWFKTNLGEGLTLTTGAGSTVAGQVLYSLA